MTFGQKLKYYREQNNLTQQQIAKLLHCDRSTYAYYETDSSEPKLDRLWRLARLYDVSVDDLLDPAFDPAAGIRRRRPKLNSVNLENQLMDNTRALALLQIVIDKTLGEKGCHKGIHFLLDLGFTGKELIDLRCGADNVLDVEGERREGVTERG